MPGVETTTTPAARRRQRQEQLESALRDEVAQLRRRKRDGSLFLEPEQCLAIRYVLGLGLERARAARCLDVVYSTVKTWCLAERVSSPYGGEISWGGRAADLLLITEGDRWERNR
jgi:hypothetical protein